jgi:hypothetical protein
MVIVAALSDHALSRTGKKNGRGKKEAGKKI